MASSASRLPRGGIFFNRPWMSNQPRFNHRKRTRLVFRDLDPDFIDIPSTDLADRDLIRSLTLF
jgi:hypothetical protein